jgi:4-hydroxy-2-oxoheptanedioate aldolase
VTTLERAVAFATTLRSGEPHFGTFGTLGCASAIEFAVAGGFDFIVVDCQHGLAGHTDMVASVRATAAHAAVPLVRVPAGDDAAIERALDCGALGVIVPAVETAERARAVALRCRYPPEGARSFGPVRAELLLGSDLVAADRLVLCIVMIESRAGLEAREEICATPGIDGVFIGPADLAVSLGQAPSAQLRPGDHAHAVRDISECARRHGRFVGIHAGTGAQAAQRAAEGFAMVTISTDAGLLRWAARTALRTARAGDS